jgi:hypothetical protein
MNFLRLLAFSLIILAVGCNRKPEPASVFTTTLGMNTPYYVAPETLNGKVKEVVEKVYLASDQDGKIVKGERLSKEARDSVNWTPEYIARFDADGNLLKCAEINNLDEVLNVTTQEIVQGKPVSSSYIENDTVRLKALFTYDESENTMKVERIRMPVDTLINIIHVRYDEAGNYSLWKFFNVADEMVFRYEFTVAEDGSSYSYSAFNRDGVKSGTRTYTKNDHGFAARDHIINRAGEETIYDMEYTYDDMGNWISRVVTSEEGSIIEERTITYYE